MSDSSPSPLNAIVLGAGIAGLGAAIALRCAGHAVTVYEKSHFRHDSGAGAGITLTPNGSRGLRAWGVDLPAPGTANVVDNPQWRILDPQTLQEVHRQETDDAEARFGAPHRLLLRGDLHHAMHKRAKELGTVIFLGREAVRLDCERGIVGFADGEADAQADLIFVADGVKSRFLPMIIENPPPLQPTGSSIFRCLIPMSSLLDDDALRPLFANQQHGYLAASSHESGVFFFAYHLPSSLSVALFHPTRPGHANDAGWNTPASLADLLPFLAPFHPLLQRIFQHVPNDSLACFPLSLRAPLPRLNKNLAFLLGDAAHPMLPTYAQGANMALEDAASLASFLSPSSPDSAPSRDLSCLLESLSSFRLDRITAAVVCSNSHSGDETALRPVWENAVLAADPKRKRKLEFRAVPFGEEQREFWHGYDVFQEAGDFRNEKGC